LRNEYKLNVDIPKDLFIMCKRVGFSQIIINLLNNAIDAMDNMTNADKSLNFSAQRTDKWSVISLKDNGPGISQSDQERIFEPFFTTKDIGKGTGLGLHIIYKEMQKMLGKIEVISAPNAGAEFKLYFAQENIVNKQINQTA